MFPQSNVATCVAFVVMGTGVRRVESDMGTTTSNAATEIRCLCNVLLDVWWAIMQEMGVVPSRMHSAFSRQAQIMAACKYAIASLRLRVAIYETPWRDIDAAPICAHSQQRYNYVNATARRIIQQCLLMLLVDGFNRLAQMRPGTNASYVSFRKVFENIQTQQPTCLMVVCNVFVQVSFG